MIYCPPSGYHCLFDSTSMVVIYICIMCVNRNKLQAICLHNSGSLGTRLEYELLDAKQSLPKYPHGQSKTCYQLKRCYNLWGVLGSLQIAFPTYAYLKVQQFSLYQCMAMAKYCYRYIEMQSLLSLSWEQFCAQTTVIVMTIMMPKSFTLHVFPDGPPQMNSQKQQRIPCSLGLVCQGH